MWSRSAGGAGRSDRINRCCTHRDRGRARGGEWTGIISQRNRRADGNRCRVGGCPGERGGLSRAHFGGLRGELRNLRWHVGRNLNGSGLRHAGAAWSGRNGAISCRLCRRVLRAAGCLRTVDDRSTGRSVGRGYGDRRRIKGLPVQRDTLAAADRSGARREGDGWSRSF